MKRTPSLFTLLASLLAGALASASAQNPIPPPPRAPTLRSNPPAASTPAPEAPAAASAAPAGSQPSTNASASGDYILSAADAVEMSVFHQPDLTTQARIANDGTVQFPLIGELKIGGLTLRDARENIRKRYNSDYLVEPQVYLNVIAYATRKFTILGQVNAPGTYAMPGGEHVGLMEAVGMAGGFTRLANRGGVEIKRTDHGTNETLKVNTKNLTTRDGKKFELMAGDVVTVGETIF